MDNIFQKPKGLRFHILAIGGIGMSGIANMLLDKGASISGTDLQENYLTENLRERGALLKPIYELSQMPNVVIVSSAIAQDNEELLFAKKMGIPVYHRALALGRLVEGKKVIAITGSHGKTTTTSLIAWMLLGLGLDPDFYIGGILKDVGKNARAGRGRIAVIELDESDGTVFSFSPDICVITNVDREHIDFYKKEDVQKRLYRKFIETNSKCRFFLGKNSPISWESILPVKLENVDFYPDKGLIDVISYSPSNGFLSDIELGVHGKSAFIRLPLIGRHNAFNLAGCLSVADYLGLDVEAAIDILEKFPGVERRMDVFYKGDVLLIHDYAHHPREIKATLDALKGYSGGSRIIAVFEPHRYTRFSGLWDEFIRAFESADTVLCTDVYSASEAPIEGVSPDSFVDKLKEQGKNALHMPAVSQLEQLINKGDIVVFMGAGKAKDYAKEFTKLIKRQLWN